MRFLTTQQVCEALQVDISYVRKITKRAANKNLSFFECRGKFFKFSLSSTIRSRGKAYSYTQIEAPEPADKPKRRVPMSTALNPADLPNIVIFKRPTAEEKLAVITFCNTSKLSYGHIAKGLICKHEAFEVKETSLETKIRRWIKAYRKGGIAALEDKRGGKEAKMDIELLKRVVLAGGTRHYTSLFFNYCYQYAKDNGLVVDLRNPVSDIHYSTFVRAVERLKATDHSVADFLRQGMDSFTYAEPSIGREWDYPNQQWEMDATPADVMVKVPVVLSENSKNEGYRDFFTREPSEHYHLVRMKIVGIADNFSNSVIYGLYDTTNYYSNMRLLHKAIKKLGKTELLRIDNGKDYVSKDFLKMLVDQGVEYYICDKGRGDQKGTIERTFRTIQHSREFESLAGFVGHNVDQRQHLENESSTKLEKLSGVATNIKGDTMWWWQFEEWLDNYLDFKQSDRYSKHTPANATELSRIYNLLGKRYFRTVSKSGIRHNSQYYCAVDLWEHAAIGEKVEIIENVDDSNRLFVFMKGQLVCEVLEKGIFRKGITLEEVNQMKKSYKQRVVNKDKKLTKQAQKEFGKFQNAVRDEFVKEEVKANKAKRQDEQAQENTGIDLKREHMRLISGGRV